jgi:hypothetical protein
MSGHTPGPWKVNRHKHIHGELWLSVLSGAWDITSNSAAKPGVIADAKYSAMSDEENEANARLIAAAPSLLEATEAFMALDNTFQAPTHQLEAIVERGDEFAPMAKAVLTARAAIAKARGENHD